MLVAHRSGAPQDRELAMVMYRAMTGGEIGEFNRLRARVLALVSNREENRDMPEPMEEKEKVELIKRTEKHLKKAKKKAKKEKGPEIKHDWTDKKDRGMRVFTPHGVAVIRGYDAKTKHYLVEVEGSEEKKVCSEGSVRFKAFKEEYRENYVVDKSVKTPSGAYAISNADKVAKALNGLNVEQCAQVAAAAGISGRFDKWSERNPGMQRMNLGNVMRAMLERDEDEAAAEKGLRVGAGMPRKEAPKVKLKVVKRAKKKAKAE